MVVRSGHRARSLGRSAARSQPSIRRRPASPRWPAGNAINDGSGGSHRSRYAAPGCPGGGILVLEQTSGRVATVDSSNLAARQVHRLAWRDARQGTGRRIRDHAGRVGHGLSRNPGGGQPRGFRDMRRPYLRCGADLPPPDPDRGSSAAAPNPRLAAWQLSAPQRCSHQRKPQARSERHSPSYLLTRSGPG